jgi:hypothetical protein
LFSSLCVNSGEDHLHDEHGMGVAEDHLQRRPGGRWRRRAPRSTQVRRRREAGRVESGRESGRESDQQRSPTLRQGADGGDQLRRPAGGARDQVRRASPGPAGGGARPAPSRPWILKLGLRVEKTRFRQGVFAKLKFTGLGRRGAM